MLTVTSRLRSVIRTTFVLGLLSVAVLAACGGASPDGPSGAEAGVGADAEIRDDSVPDAAAAATVADDMDDWARSLGLAVSTLQAERNEAVVRFDKDWEGAGEFEAQRALYGADAGSINTFLAAVPTGPADPDAAERFDELVAASTGLRDDADRIVAELDAQETDLRALTEGGGSDAVLGHPALAEIIGAHGEWLERWRIACFDLQAVLADQGRAPIDCVGVDHPSALPVGDPVDADLFDVEVACVSGATMAELPYDHTRYDWQVALPDDTAWVRTLVTITSRAERPIQVRTDFRIRYEDADGEKLLEADWTEPFEPAFHVRPGQVVHRTGYAFDGLTFARPLRGEEVSTASISSVFDRLDRCVLPEHPVAQFTESDPFIDGGWAERVELTCRPGPDGSHHEGIYRVENPTDETVVVTGAAFEILDRDGTRLGMGGISSPLVVGPGEDGEVIGWSVLYTIVEPERIDSCRLMELVVTD